MSELICCDCKTYRPKARNRTGDDHARDPARHFKNGLLGFFGKKVLIRAAVGLHSLKRWRTYFLYRFAKWLKVILDRHPLAAVDAGTHFEFVAKLGLAVRMICRSFSFSVSRLESILTSSKTAAKDLRFVNDQESFDSFAAAGSDSCSAVSGVFLSGHGHTAPRSSRIMVMTLWGSGRC